MRTLLDHSACDLRSTAYDLRIVHAVTDFHGQLHLLGHSDRELPLHSAAAGRCCSTDNQERSARRLLMILSQVWREDRKSSLAVWRFPATPKVTGSSLKLPKVTVLLRGETRFIWLVNVNEMTKSRQCQ